MVRLLLDKGAYINAKDSYERTALHLAAFDGHKDIVQLLLDRGADVNPKDGDGYTPFHYARGGGHKRISHMLLDEMAKADQNQCCTVS